MTPNSSVIAHVYLVSDSTYPLSPIPLLSTVFVCKDTREAANAAIEVQCKGCTYTYLTRVVFQPGMGVTVVKSDTVLPHGLRADNTVYSVDTGELFTR